MDLATLSVPGLRQRRKSHEAERGQIQLILGPMFSGKSTELIRRLKRYQVARYSCLIVKYARDDRYESADNIATHDRQMLKAVKAAQLAELDHLAQEADVVGIDEGQFFPDVVEFSERLANAGKTVVVAALDGTFRREGFASILNLVPLAEHVVKLSAVCMGCLGEAAFTLRTSADQRVEVIGGAEMYSAVCRRCHNNGQMGHFRKPLGEIELNLDENVAKKSKEENKQRNVAFQSDSDINCSA